MSTTSPRWWCADYPPKICSRSPDVTGHGARRAWGLTAPDRRYGNQRVTAGCLAHQTLTSKFSSRSMDGVLGTHTVSESRRHASPTGEGGPGALPPIHVKSGDNAACASPVGSRHGGRRGRCRRWVLRTCHESISREHPIWWFRTGRGELASLELTRARPGGVQRDGVRRTDALLRFRTRWHLRHERRRREDLGCLATRWHGKPHGAFGNLPEHRSLRCAREARIPQLHACRATERPWCRALLRRWRPLVVHGGGERV